MIIDTISPITPAVAATLVEAGVQGVIKYSARATRWPHKRWTAAEIATCHAAGLAVGLVHQDSNDAVQHFSATAGADQASHAVAFAARLGFPAGSTVFFAADFSPAANDLPRLAAHLTAAGDIAAAAGYRLGVYGAGLLLDHLPPDDHGRPVVRWLAGALGWTGSRATLARGAWQLRQFPPRQLAGIAVDLNSPAPGWDPVRLGLWLPAPAPDRDRWRVDPAQIRTSLRLRARPSLLAPVLTRLGPGTRVTATGPAQDGWRPVRIEGGQGWVASRYLVREGSSDA